MVYIKTKLRRSVTKEDTGSTSATTASSVRDASTNQQRGDKADDTATKMTLVNLSVEQTKGLNYPINCPVWYNFSQSQSSGTIHEGIVQAVSLDIISKRLVFKVQRKHDESVHTVVENDIGYATNCPITLSSSTTTTNSDNDNMTSSETPMDGEVMFAKPMKDENGNSEMTYIIMFLPSGGEKHIIKIEEGVKASRLKYRETEQLSKQQSQDDTTKEGVHSSTEGSSKNGIIVQPFSLAVSEEEKSCDEQSRDKPPSENVNVQDVRLTRGDRMEKTKKIVKKLCKSGGSNMRMPKVKAECMYQPNNHRNKRNYHSAAGPRNTNVPRGGDPRGDTRDYSYCGRTSRNDHPIRNNEYQRYEDTGRGTTRDYNRQASHGSVSVPSQASKRTKIEEKSEDASQSMCCEPPHASYENDGAI